MTAVTWLLDSLVRPVRGSLTLWLANDAAYERLRADDLANQTRHRFVDRDLNRAWGDDVLRDDHSSVEARRARALLPFVESLDALLDIHSTTFCERPFLVYLGLPRNRALADAIGVPATQVLMTGRQHSRPDHERAGSLRRPGGGRDVTWRGMRHASLIRCRRGGEGRGGALPGPIRDPAAGLPRRPCRPRPSASPTRYEIRQVFRPRSDSPGSCALSALSRRCPQASPSW